MSTTTAYHPKRLNRHRHLRSKLSSALFKSPSRIMLITLAALVIFLVTLLIQNHKLLIYPVLHRSQPPPQEIIDKNIAKIPQEAIKLEVIEHGSRYQHQVALTFDADMTPAMYLMLKKGFVKSWYNKGVKETLDREQVKATIFLGGLWTKAYPKEAYELAHDPLLEIGNHSYNHYAFTNVCFGLPFIPNSQDINDVEEAQKIIFQATGVTPKYFRFPGGCYDKVDLQTLIKLNLQVIHWDVVAGDGFNNNAQSIVNTVLSKVQNGSIVVFHIHDGSYAPKTNDALVKIIPALKKQGYQFVTISEMLNH